MARLARSEVFKADEVGVYHTFNRTCRRSWLHGVDPLTGVDHSHRRDWFQQRMKFLSQNFCLDILAFAIMSNHWHCVIRNRPDLVRKMTARRCNIEDECTGRFFESRFDSNKLEDEADVLACMAYVDLNPIRSGMVDSLDAADANVSIAERLRGLDGEPVDSASWLAPLELASEVDGQSVVVVNDLSAEEIERRRQDLLQGFAGVRRGIRDSRLSRNRRSRNHAHKPRRARKRTVSCSGRGRESPCSPAEGTRNLSLYPRTPGGHNDIPNGPANSAQRTAMEHRNCTIETSMGLNLESRV